MNRKIHPFHVYRVFCLLSAFLLLCAALAGCAAPLEENTAKKSRGRYVEHTAGAKNGEIRDIRELEDGRLCLASSSGVYDSEDQGETWEQRQGLPGEVQEDFSRQRVTNAAISRTGDFLYEKDGGCRLVTADGDVKTVELRQEDGEPLDVWALVFADNGDLLCQGENQQLVYQLDGETLEIKHIYGEEQAQGQALTENSFWAVGGRLYMAERTTEMGDNDAMVYSSSRVNVYDLETFAGEGRAEALEELLESAFTDTEPLMLPGTDGKSLYLAGRDGIYRWYVDGTAGEKLFDGGRGHMNFANAIGGTVYGEASVLLLYWDEEEENAFYRYEYDPEAALEPEKTLTVYSLYENYWLRQAITTYQEKEPDIWIDYETGLTGTDALTQTDALKILNTNIMAGEGPDILLLDGLPLEAYLEKGLLLELDDVLGEISREDGLFENIAGAYETEKGICAVPGKFLVPVIFGREEEVSRADTLENLALLLEEKRAENPEAADLLGSMSQSMLLKCLMPASSPAWLDEGGMPDEKKLEEFFTLAKRISDAQGKSEVYAEDTEQGRMELTPFMSSAAFTALNMGYTGASFSMGNMGSADGMCNLASMLERLGEGSYAAAPGQAGEGVFIPMDPVGVSVKTKEEAAAKDFVKYLLTDGQQFGEAEGWPVNKKAFSKALEKPEYFQEGPASLQREEDGKTFDLELRWPGEAVFEELEERLEKLEVPALTDERLDEAVYQAGMKCLAGEAGPSQAAAQVADATRLYLAE